MRVRGEAFLPSKRRMRPSETARASLIQVRGEGTKKHMRSPMCEKGIELGLGRVPGKGADRVMLMRREGGRGRLSKELGGG